jgi:serine protease Do
MHSRPSALFSLVLYSIITFTAIRSAAQADTNIRETPLVRAIAHCSASVVNLRGRKTIPNESPSTSESAVKQVNGMGTGVVIDSRGYILTNYHVVQGVKKIEVTTSNRKKTTGRLMAHDPVTDLAILKIDTEEALPVIKIGTSTDLMLAETVAAVGNAYGYEHTVTVGIISQLGRTVQVNEEQVYRNLIQTDAPINPGNSGGPLLNLDGEMIGINVAVRIGAQGIAFAIPVNDAMEVAANLMSQLVPQEVAHGISAVTIYENNKPKLVVDSIDPSSPAAEIGLTKGDEIVSVDGKPVSLALDLQRSLLDRAVNDSLNIVVNQSGSTKNLTLRLEQNANQTSDIAWETLGLKLRPVSSQEMAGRHENYQRGLRVVSVQPDSSADKEGIMPGDILVAMHGWKTESLENLAYILDQKDVRQHGDFMFYILRDKEPFWGQMRIAERRSP